MRGAEAATAEERRGKRNRSVRGSMQVTGTEAKSSLHAWVRILAAIPCCALLLGGLLKLYDLSSFMSDLYTWSLIPEQMRRFVAVGVPIVEVAVGSSFLLFKGSQIHSGAIAASVLIGFALAYTVQFSTGNEPKCGCFGPLSQFSEMKAGITETWVVNTLLAVPGVLSVWLNHRRRAS